MHHDVESIPGGFTITGYPDLTVGIPHEIIKLLARTFSQQDVDDRLKPLIDNKENEDCDEFALVDMDEEEARDLLWEMHLPTDTPLGPAIRKAHYNGPKMFLGWDPKKTRWIHYASGTKPWISFRDVQDNELMRLQL